MNRGEIHVVPFLYTSQQRVQRRPACVVSVPAFNAGPDVVVTMITSSARRLSNPGLGDVVLADWASAGLPQPSVVRTGRLLAVARTLALGPVGSLSERDVAAVDQALREVLGLA